VNMFQFGEPRTDERAGTYPGATARPAIARRGWAFGSHNKHTVRSLNARRRW